MKWSKFLATWNNLIVSKILSLSKIASKSQTAQKCQKIKILLSLWVSVEVEKVQSQKRFPKN